MMERYAYAHIDRYLSNEQMENLKQKGYQLDSLKMKVWLFADSGIEVVTKEDNQHICWYEGRNKELDFSELDYSE